ncbi:hypothetical protein [Pseudomonas sp. HMWF021]|uniref:hypothetical protein n=1 Tax=Pseudomonas sp. HMWF021 TaxID=2056857 RepID=UPI000D3823FF|nr:hypothetical protein [Pseudomonas sp. HMWF021]PTT24739.1 hypothetical protein DBR18_26510 [Pseudomonas sp. HMWF021]
MIPGYRVRIYCLIGALLCLLVAWASAEQLYTALTNGQLDALTGWRPHKTREHLALDEQPFRFTFYFLQMAASFVAFTGAGLALSWGVIRGRKAFRRWYT